jgi:DNA-binding NarL/FixJ family response regulator
VPDTKSAVPSPLPVPGPDTPIVPAVLPILEQLTAVASVARDESLRLVWCNRAYAEFSRRTVQELIGTRMEDYIPKAAADERARPALKVMQSGRAMSYYQFGADQRLLCSVFPLDESAFGHKGVLVVIQPAPPTGALDAVHTDIPVIGTPCLDDFAALTPAELRVLYHLAAGKATAEIGDHLHRAAKTVEKQIESIHRKLGTKSRAELVRQASESGLQGFDEQAWEQIIEGARRMKRIGDSSDGS